MTTLAAKIVRADVAAVSVRFTDDMVYILLSDGRELGLPVDLPWLAWLAAATSAQRARWSLEPRGYAIYWEDLDDGIEIAPLLTPQSV